MNLHRILLSFTFVLLVVSLSVTVQRHEPGAFLILFPITVANLYFCIGAKP